MPTHREIVEKMPTSMQRRPRDHRGYPVPWFTPRNPETGEWDFRHVHPDKAPQAIRENRCWTCGENLTRPCAFVIGPMCAVNRISSEPPSHVECALYAAKACPFLARPKMERPSGHEGILAGGEVAGLALMRNPGVAMVWVTNTPTYLSAIRLFDVGEPLRVKFFARSEPATREEILESIESGLPVLRELAEKDGGDAMEQLDAQVAVAMELIPA